MTNGAKSIVIVITLWLIVRTAYNYYYLPPPGPRVPAFPLPSTQESSPIFPQSENCSNLILVDSDDTFFDGVPKPDEVTAASLGLQALAHQSGGQVLIGARSIPAGVAACMADAKSYYELTFDSPPAAQFGEYHSLEVKVDRPGLTVRTNTVYYAEQ